MDLFPFVNLAIKIKNLLWFCIIFWNFWPENQYIKCFWPQYIYTCNNNSNVVVLTLLTKTNYDKLSLNKESNILWWLSALFSGSFVDRVFSLSSSEGINNVLYWIGIQLFIYFCRYSDSIMHYKCHFIGLLVAIWWPWVIFFCFPEDYEW